MTRPTGTVTQAAGRSGIRSASRRWWLRVVGIVLAVGVLAVVVTAMTRLSGDPEPSGAAADVARWELRGSDEFDGNALDPQKWSDSEEWERGGHATGDAWYPQPAPPSNLAVDDGELRLSAVRAPGSPGGKNITSAQVNSRGNAALTLPENTTSFVEFRAKIPAGAGLQPALWLLGDGTNADGRGWPINGEIDMAEFANNRAGDAGRPYSSIWYAKDVFTKPPGTFLNATHVAVPESTAPRPDLQEGWHVWGLERAADHMTLYVDGQRMWTVRPGQVIGNGAIPLPDVVFRAPMHVRVAIGVGGEWAGRGVPPDAVTGGDLMVDYVRTWTSRSGGS